MARPRKRINNTPYPDHIIDAVARTFYPKLLEDWHMENQMTNIEPTITKKQDKSSNILQHNYLSLT